MLRLAIIVAALAHPVMADVKSRDGSIIDCYCTDKTGARVELGEVRCLQVDGRMFMARCEMSLNNPMWREVSEGCMSSERVLSPLPDLVFDQG